MRWGSAAIYALAHVEECRGILHLIDNEKVNESNLNRYVLMRRRDRDCWKVDVACEALGRTAIQPVVFRDAFSYYVKENGAKIELLLSPVDSEEGRRGLARTLPRQVINAATGGTTVTVSTHGFNDGKACLHCLYQLAANHASREEIMAAEMGLALETVRELVKTNAPIGAELVSRIEVNRGVERGRWAGNVGEPINSFYVRAVCGEAELSLPHANVIAPLSFISASAGILLAVELIKSGHPGNLVDGRWTTTSVLIPFTPRIRLFDGFGSKIDRASAFVGIRITSMCIWRSTVWPRNVCVSDDCHIGEW